MSGYKPVFATMPKAHDSSRSSQSSGGGGGDQRRHSGASSSYDRYYDGSGYSSIPSLLPELPSRRKGILEVLIARIHPSICEVYLRQISISKITNKRKKKKKSL